MISHKYMRLASCNKFMVCAEWWWCFPVVSVKNHSCVHCIVSIVSTCLVILYISWWPWNLHIHEFYCFRMQFSCQNIMYMGLFLCCSGYQSFSVKSMVKASLYSNNWIIYSNSLTDKSEVLPMRNNHAMKMGWEVYVKLHTSLTLPPDGSNGQLHTPATLSLLSGRLPLIPMGFEPG